MTEERAATGDEDGDGASDRPEENPFEDFDGCAGCVEVWEHLSERREETDDRRGSPE